MLRMLLNWFRKDKVYKMSCDDFYMLEFLAREHVQDGRIEIVQPVFIDWKSNYAILYKVIKK